LFRFNIRTERICGGGPKRIIIIIIIIIISKAHNCHIMEPEYEASIVAIFRPWACYWHNQKLTITANVFF